jgi:hypothetical protein
VPPSLLFPEDRGRNELSHIAVKAEEPSGAFGGDRRATWLLRCPLLSARGGRRWGTSVGENIQMYQSVIVVWFKQNADTRARYQAECRYQSALPRNLLRLLDLISIRFVYVR